MYCSSHLPPSNSHASLDRLSSKLEAEGRRWRLFGIRACFPRQNMPEESKLICSPGRSLKYYLKKQQMLSPKVLQKIQVDALLHRKSTEMPNTMPQRETRNLEKTDERLISLSWNYFDDLNYINIVNPTYVMSDLYCFDRYQQDIQQHRGWEWLLERCPHLWLVLIIVSVILQKWVYLRNTHPHINFRLQKQTRQMISYFSDGPLMQDRSAGHGGPIRHRYEHHFLLAVVLRNDE